ANFMDAHSPYAPAGAARGRFGPSSPFDDCPARLSFALSETELRRQADRYDEKLLELDAILDELLTHLESSGRLDRCWVFLVADHGEAFGAHGTLMHGG